MADDRSAPMASAAFEARKPLRAARDQDIGNGPPTEAAVYASGYGRARVRARLVNLAAAVGSGRAYFVHLRIDPRCSICVRRRNRANPQTAPRVTVTGIAEVADDPVLKARFLAVHPVRGAVCRFR